MKAILFIFTLLLSVSVFADTAEEKEKAEVLRLRKREQRFKSTTYTPASSETCDDATKITKEIQRLVLEAKYGDGEAAIPLSELEKEYHAKKAEVILYTGLNNLNMKYKGFLSSVAGVDGWKPMEGMTESGFSLDKLKADLIESEEHIKNVETMAFMDQLLKEGIEDHKNLTDPESTKAKVEAEGTAQLAVGMPLIHNNISGSKTFDQLIKHCSEDHVKKLICKIYDGSTDKGKATIKASMVGFVDAYRMSKRSDFTKSLTSNLIRDDLGKYRKQLLLGIEDKTAENLKEEIASFKEKNAELQKIANLNSSKLGTMVSSIKEYQTCLAAETLNGKPGAKKCELADKDSKEYVKTLNNLAQVQYDVVQKLGGKNETIVDRMQKVHNHQQVKANLENVKKLYAQQPEFEKLFEEKIAAEKETIKKDVSEILNSVLSKSTQSDVALQLKGGSTQSSFDKLLKGHATISLVNKKDRLASVSHELNLRLNTVKCSDRSEVAPQEDNDADTIEKCAEAKTSGEDGLFIANGDQLDVNPSKLEEYLKELNEGKLAENTKKKLDELSAEMAALKTNIDSIRASDKYATLNRLLAHYARKAKKSCKGFTGRELVSCVSKEEGGPGTVATLFKDAKTILATMPESPGSMQISQLNQDCNTAFMNGFSKEDQKIVNPICNAILKENESFSETLKPTKEEIKNKRHFTYWNGTEVVTEVRQRDRWMVTQAVASGAINFLPSYLDHQIKKSSIDSWETSTIEGIKYRNGMLDNYYTYGIYGNNGYFGGSPDYLSNWGGSVYNNGFQTVGSGGFFSYTQPAVTPVIADANAGFSF